ncbi:hypothetical protein EJB05_31885, partial [Eragrostis curvula]
MAAATSSTRMEFRSSSRSLLTISARSLLQPASSPAGVRHRRSDPGNGDGEGRICIIVRHKNRLGMLAEENFRHCNKNIYDTVLLAH